MTEEIKNRIETILNNKDYPALIAYFKALPFEEVGIPFEYLMTKENIRKHQNADFYKAYCQMIEDFNTKLNFITANQVNNFAGALFQQLKFPENATYVEVIKEHFNTNKILKNQLLSGLRELSADLADIQGSHSSGDESIPDTFDPHPASLANQMDWQTFMRHQTTPLRATPLRSIDINTICGYFLDQKELTLIQDYSQQQEALLKFLIENENLFQTLFPESDYRKLVNEINQRLNPNTLMQKDIDENDVFMAFLEGNEKELFKTYQHNLNDLAESVENMKSLLIENGIETERLNTFLVSLKERPGLQSRSELLKPSSTNQNHLFTTDEINTLSQGLNNNRPIQEQLGILTPQTLEEVKDTLDTTAQHIETKAQFLIEYQDKPIFFPINTGGLHWILLVLSRDRQTLVCYDSLFRQDCSFMEKLKTTLDSLFNTQIETKIAFTEAIQQDAVNCGPWVITFMEAIRAEQTLELDINQLKAINIGKTRQAYLAQLYPNGEIPVNPHVLSMIPQDIKNTEGSRYYQKEDDKPFPLPLSPGEGISSLIELPIETPKKENSLEPQSSNPLAFFLITGKTKSENCETAINNQARPLH